MTRHEQRYKAMTILYQAFLYKNNNINYNIKDIIHEQLDEDNKFIEMLVNGVMENIEVLDDIANKYYPGLSRGIYKKEGPGVDGIYNQDISSNSILIELGGVDNNIDEVLNTTEAISNILYYYIKG